MTTSSLFRCTLYKQALFGELIRICSATRKTCYLLECLAPSAQNPNDRSKNASAIIGVYGRHFSFFLPSRVSYVGLQTPNSGCCPGDVRSLLCLFSFFVFLQRKQRKRDSSTKGSDDNFKTSGRWKRTNVCLAGLLCQTQSFPHVKSLPLWWFLSRAIIGLSYYGSCFCLLLGITRLLPRQSGKSRDQGNIPGR